jgi:nitroreductase
VNFEEIVSWRRSVKHYDPNHQVSDAELKRIFDRVILAPSSYNLQHWRFVVVRDAERKSRIRQAAFGQEQVEKASAVIVVLGRLRAYLDAATIYADTPERVRESLIPMIQKGYEGQPMRQRDEAIRSASLAAMILMLAAADLGYATGPMIGFDPQAVQRIIGFDDDHVPVMLVVLGKPIGEMRPRAFRFPPEEIVRLESWDGPGLGA